MLDQPDIPRLNVGIDPRPGPVPMHRQHGRAWPLDRLGSIEVGRHPHAGPALERQSFDDIPVAIERAEHFRLERTRLRGFVSERSVQTRGDHLETLLPDILCCWRPAPLAGKDASLLANELQVGALWGRGGRFHAWLRPRRDRVRALPANVARDGTVLKRPARTDRAISCSHQTMDNDMNSIVEESGQSQRFS
jgi:hypothetical protein